jgi:GntR family transcriptional regulator, carbon starvation induced regulator
MVLNDDVESIGNVTFRKIRNDIIHGIWRPADRLPLEKLKQHYGVSVSTLREILVRLSMEGLVLAEGQRGFEVAPASEADMRDLGELRLLLESRALGLSLERGDLDWEARVVAAHHKLAAIERQLLGGESQRTSEWIAYDRSFHEALVSACGSPALMTMHVSVFDRFVRYHMLAERFRGRAVADDHRALLDAALARDVRKAQDLLQAHVHKGIDHVIASGRISRAA